MDRRVKHVKFSFSLQTKLSWIILILDIGCKAGKYLSCLNNGSCLDSGICECPFGFNGLKCEKCKLYLLNDKFVLLIFLILLDLGCNAGGHLSCLYQAKYCMEDGSCGNKIVNYLVYF